MKKNYTVLFIFLFGASIAGGMALENYLDYSMIVGVGLATFFILASAFSLGKKNRERKSNKYIFLVNWFS